MAHADFDYDMVFVGRGYSIATYLFYADLKWAEKLLLVGGPDSWDETVRGHGVVNHARYIFARRALERRPSAQEPVDRTELVNSNKAIIDFIRESRGTSFDDHEGIVQAIGASPTTLTEDVTRNVGDQMMAIHKAGEQIPIYEIAYVDKMNCTHSVKALKVVYGGGAGPQRVPGFVTKALEAFPEENLRENVLDLDSFMRLFGRANKQSPPSSNGNRKVMGLVGPNAGIDGAIAAINQGFSLYWLIRGRDNKGQFVKPAWIPTRHYKIYDGQRELTGEKAVELANGFIVNYEQDAESDIELIYDTSSKKLKIAIPKKLKPKWGSKNNRPSEDSDNYYIENLDLFTYAVGQDPEGSESAPGDGNRPRLLRVGPGIVLKQLLGGGTEKLRPVYDINQRFGAPYASVVGLQAAGTSRYGGVEVIGASAFALASDRANRFTEHAYFDRLAETARELPSVDSASPEELRRRFESARRLVLQTTKMGNDLVEFFLTENHRKVPTVRESMMSVARKLNQQSVGTGDQLGTVRAQIEAITGFDLRTDSIGVWGTLASSGEQFIKAAHDIIRTFGNGSDDVVVTRFEELKDRARGLQSELSCKERPLSCVLETVVDEKVAASFRSMSEAMRNDLGTLLTRDALDQQYVKTTLTPLRSRVVTLKAFLERIAAVQSFDFNGMDPTALAVALAGGFPDINPDDWEGLIDKIIEGRWQSPWGYDPGQTNKMMKQLKEIDEGKRLAKDFVAPPPSR